MPFLLPTITCQLSSYEEGTYLATVTLNMLKYIGLSREDNLEGAEKSHLGMQGVVLSGKNKHMTNGFVSYSLKLMELFNVFVVQNDA